MFRHAAAAALALCLASSVAMAGPAEDKLAEGDRIRQLEWDEGKALDALAFYDEAHKLGADEFEVEWRKASAYFWAGENTKDSKKLAEWGTKGVAHAEKAAKLKPDRVEGHYYTAVCWGTYSHGVSIFSALKQGVEKKFLNAITKAKEIDETFEDGAPLNALGRFYFELPWPKRDLAKSEKILAKNISNVPCNLRTHVYYAETVAAMGGKIGGKDAKDLAKEHLKLAIEGTHCPANPGDGDLAKKWAKKQLKDLE